MVRHGRRQATMTPSASEDPDDLPDAILEEAAIWHARMREPEEDDARRAEKQREFGDWLAADPRHAQALDETERLWDALERPVEQAMTEEQAMDRQPHQGTVPEHIRSGLTRLGTPWLLGSLLVPRAGALVACLLVMFAAGTVWHDDISVALTSDYATAVGERRPVALADGSKIVLNTDSAIAVALGPAARHVRLLKGEAWFDVASDTARPFTVETPQGTVEVTGTGFDVRHHDGVTVVSLAEGRVELTTQARPASRVVLAPGQQARLSAVGISAPVPFDRVAVTAWLRGQMVFYDTPLPEVLAELNRHRSGRIVVLDNDLDRLKITGVFETDDPDAALSVIEDTLPVRLTRLTDYLVLVR